MTYATLVGALTALGAIAVERAARLGRIPTRWIWAAAIPLAIGLSMRTPEIDVPVGVPTFGYESGAQARGVPAATADWLTIARWRLAETERQLDAARVLKLSRLSSVTRFNDGYAIGAWIMLSALLAITFVIVHARLGRARSQWPRAELHNTEVRLSAHVGPAAIGLVRSEIVVPAWLLARSAAEQRMALAHESSHRRARDPQLLGVAWVALILFPWNPALWVMVSRLRLAIEVDCDRRVLRDGASPSAYGSLLIAVAELAIPLRPSALALADDSSHLKTRILAMDTHLPKFGRVRAGIAALIGAVALLAACEAKEPTAADVDAMSAATAEQTARQLHLIAADTGSQSHVHFIVDSVRMSPEAARRIGAPDIVSMRIVPDGNSGSEVSITTNRLRTRTLMSADSVAKDEVRTDPPLPRRTGDGRELSKVVSDSSVAWFLNGARVDYATVIARLDRKSIESVEVLKGPAAAAEYGVSPGWKVIAFRTKGGGSK